MNTSKHGFTLIEMLVVCLIIVLLAGLVFRMVSAVGRADDKASTRAKLEMVAHALEEFKSIYGKYPPVRLYPTKRGMMPVFGYEYPSAHHRTYGDTYDEWYHAAQTIHGEGRGRFSDWADVKVGDAIFTFGLCSFFVPRVNGAAGEAPGRNNRQSPFLMKEFRIGQWTDFNTGNADGDSRRDLDAVRRILPHLDAALSGDDTLKFGRNKWGSNNAGILEIPWEGVKRLGDTKTNENVTIKDAWGNDLIYYSVPPFESYKLWSSGPDGMTVGDTCNNSAHGHVGGVVRDGDDETQDDLFVGQN